MRRMTATIDTRPIYVEAENRLYDCYECGDGVMERKPCTSPTVLSLATSTPAVICCRCAEKRPMCAPCYKRTMRVATRTTEAAMAMIKMTMTIDEEPDDDDEDDEATEDEEDQATTARELVYDSFTDSFISFDPYDSSDISDTLDAFDAECPMTVRKCYFFTDGDSCTSDLSYQPRDFCNFCLQQIKPTEDDYSEYYGPDSSNTMSNCTDCGGECYGPVFAWHDPYPLTKCCFCTNHSSPCMPCWKRVANE